MMEIIEQDRPGPDLRKRMLTAKIAQLRQEGYTHELRIVVLVAQLAASPEESRERDKVVAEARAQVANCYRAARALEVMLEDVAAPKEPTAG